MTSGTSPDASHLKPFTIGDWFVEPKACHLSRGDTVVRLRPQLTDLLVCLARRAGEIVLKEEILEEVWPGQYIAESGLSRCVAELRQALHDDIQEPRFIETFPKRGYRLIAPVVWLDHPESVVPAHVPAAAAHAPAAPAHVPAAPAHVPAAPAGAEPDGLAVAEPETADAAGHAVNNGPASSEPPVRRPWGGLRRRGVFVAAAGVLLIGILATVLLVRSPASALTEKDTVLLADVSNATTDRVFDDTLRLALAVNLEQAPFLRILPQEAVHAALVRSGRLADDLVVGPVALDLCRREGAAVLLAGSIAPLGSRYAVGLEAIVCGTGEAIGRAIEEAQGKESVLTALERAATRIRRALGESRDSLRQHDMPLAQATTPSFDALKAVTQGDFNRDHARVGEALALYRQATELDPGFARAWASRGAAASNLGLREESTRSFRRAFELRERVSPQEGFYIAGHYYRSVAGDPQKAIEIYQAWKRTYPGSPVPPNNLAGIYSNAFGQYDAALPEGREAVRLAPYSSVAYNALIFACRGCDRIAEARAAAAEARGRGVDDRILHAQLLNLALIDGDQAALEREIRWAANDPLAELFTLQVRASAAGAGGRLAEARRLWSEAQAEASEIGPPRRAADIRLLRAESEALVGDAGAARKEVDAALALNTEPATVAVAAIVSALAGDPARARAILTGIGQPTDLDSATLLVWLPTARTLVEAGLGRAEEAGRILLPVARFERGVEARFVPIGVRALLAQAAGRPSEAAAAFDQLIRLRAIDPASPWLAVARLGLARALRDSGDTVRSLAAYEDFLTSWKDADAGAPLLMAARRERSAIALR